MSIFEGHTWGLGTPNLPKLGARAILHRGSVDFLGDRAGIYGEPSAEWQAECDKVLPHFLKQLTKMAKAYQICTDMDEVFRLEHKGWVCEASPRRSYGYLYIDIYRPAT
ncbi:MULTISPECIES: type IV toxin-antitoxin system YeeU family antitoxin [Aeromonas]|uniref:type IV toxin-antitoxin system YeeU family antitoxin n=1 Tax=Aeromonas TaxID=642 RepID=UPI0022E4E933|nr:MULTISPECIES: type IV toxin-antitoxin system YeeU family antitoxin [Aeromonas]